MTDTTDVIEDDDLEPLADETVQQARRLVATYSENADDCRTLLSMLGLTASPSSPPCGKCGRPIGRTAAGGYNRHVGNGVCGVCYETAQRVARKARKAVQ